MQRTATLILIFFILPVAGFFINTSDTYGQMVAGEKLEDLDQFIEKGMADWEIPGMAISVVKDDEVVYAKGFGVKKLGEDEQVNKHTLFC